MTAKKLPLAADLEIPLEVATHRVGWLGNPGTGKTYGAQRLAELLHAAGAQFVVLDPVGKWWSLRLAADGKSAGLPVPVFGGLKGDAPLPPDQGAYFADLVHDRATSAVLDVSQFESDAAKARFARDFAGRLYFRRKTAPAVIHVFLEEAQEFIPQNPNNDETKMLHEFVRMVKIGRNFGFGISIITQRPQEVNKKALNLCELLLVYQLTGTHERKSVQEWIGDKGIKEDIAGELPRLQRGRPHLWSPAWLQVSRVVAISEKWTFDASSTPKVGQGVARERPLSPIDLQQINKDLAAIIAKSKAEDPKALAARIRELEAAAKKAGHAAAAARPAEPKVVEKPVLKDAQISRLEKTAERLASLASGPLKGLLEGLAGVAREITVGLAAAKGARGPAGSSMRVQVPLKGDGGYMATVAPRPPRPRADGPGVDLGRGEKKTLTAIAQNEWVTREQLTVITGYTKSSRNTYLQRLAAAGYIEIAGDRIRILDAGVTALGADYEPIPTGDALREHWLRELSGGEQKVLQLLADVYPEGLTREAISEASGYTKSSRNTYLQRLGARRLVTIEDAIVRAAAELFG